MIKPEMVPEPVWRAAMSAYHKTLRKNPAMAWQEAVVAMLNAWLEWPETVIMLPVPNRGVGNGEPITERHRLGDRQYRNAERIFGDDQP